MSINHENLKKVFNSLKKENAIDLMAVTKNRSLQDVRELIANGVNIFGENRVQEAKIKFNNISNPNVKVHLIGPLQTNKVLEALQTFDVIQSIDRVKLVNVISKYLKNTGMQFIRTKEFFIQVNIGEEIQKSGVSISELTELYKYSIASGLNIVGIMCIPPLNHDPSIYFKKTLDLKNSLNPKLRLSMGMSNDFILAINYKTNLIRIGSYLFLND